MVSWILLLHLSFPPWHVGSPLGSPAMSFNAFRCSWSPCRSSSEAWRRSQSWKMMEITWKYLRKYGTSMELPSTAWHFWRKGMKQHHQWPPAINGRLMSFGITIGKLHGNMVWPMWTLWTYNQTKYVFHYHNVNIIYIVITMVIILI